MDNDIVKCKRCKSEIATASSEIAYTHNCKVLRTYPHGQPFWQVYDVVCDKCEYKQSIAFRYNP